MLSAISHVAFTVKAPARTAKLFQDLFDARVLERQDADGHLETLVRLAGTWLVLVGVEVERELTGDHLAFRATPEVLEATAAKLKAMGRDCIRARGDTALYFFDYDDHVFELDTEDPETEN